MEGRCAYVYGLFDSAEQTIRYVGQTVKPNSRLSMHQGRAAIGSNAALFNWIGNIIDGGRRPCMVILEVCSESDVTKYELEWYKRIDMAGVNTFNFHAFIADSRARGEGSGEMANYTQYTVIEPAASYRAYAPDEAEYASKFGILWKFVTSVAGVETDGYELEDQSMSHKSVHLTDAQCEKAIQLGNGSLSLGVRMAVDAAPEVLNHERARTRHGKSGRPCDYDSRMTPHPLYMSAAQWDKAKRIGGNWSKGCRLAVDAMPAYAERTGNRSAAVRAALDAVMAGEAGR